MPIQHVKISTLSGKNRNAFCFACGEKAVEAKADATWMIWTSDMTYCQRCAKKEGIGPNGHREAHQESPAFHL